jgi:hypothetical protein
MISGWRGNLNLGVEENGGQIFILYFLILGNAIIAI